MALMLDFTKQSAENVNAGWMLTGCNENGELAICVAGTTTNLDDYEDEIKHAAARAVVFVVVIDDVAPTADGHDDSRVVKIKLWVPSAVFVLQDRWHVSHHLNAIANPFHSDFYGLFVLAQRNVIVHPQPQIASALDARLLGGKITKEGTFRKTELIISASDKPAEGTGAS